MAEQYITNEQGEREEASDLRQYQPIEPGEDDAIDDYRDYEPLGPRFGFVESFFLIGVNLIADILEVFFDLTGVGVVVSFAIDWIIGPSTILWLFLKGVDGVVGRNAIAQAVELVPFIDMLPVRTVAILITILATNYPDKFKTFARIMNVGKKLKGKK